MSNQERIEVWVREYLEHIQRITIDKHVNNEEGYKFVAVDNFQRYFNLNNPNIVGMLEKSILINNLVVNSHYYPRKMLLLYALEYPVETKAALTNLFDESREVYIRITETVENFNQINEIRNKKNRNPLAHSYIGLRFLSLLLSFRFPSKYNALKPTEWKFFARFIAPDFFIPNLTPTGEQYRAYETYIEELREYINNREDIKSIKDALTRGLSFTDQESHWITQDIIYVTARLLAGEKSHPGLEHDVVSSDEDDMSTEDVNEDDSTFGPMPLEAHLEEYMVKNWNIIDFGEKLTLYREEDGTPGQQYVTDVGIIDILAKDAKNNFVVIELKRAESKYQVLGQVLNYMSWVGDNLVVGNEKVRGMIVVGKAEDGAVDVEDGYFRFFHISIVKF